MSTVYLIPSILSEEGIAGIPSYVLSNALRCQVFFVENERTARRYLKSLRKEIVIDNYEWFVISDENRISRYRQPHDCVRPLIIAYPAIIAVY